MMRIHQDMETSRTIYEVEIDDHNRVQLIAWRLFSLAGKIQILHTIP
jgi:hypothetical protein